jgi:hypothetical protein
VLAAPPLPQAAKPGTMMAGTRVPAKIFFILKLPY